MVVSQRRINDDQHASQEVQQEFSPEDVLNAFVNRIAFAGCFYRLNHMLKELDIDSNNSCENEGSLNTWFEYCGAHFRDERQLKDEVDYRIGFRSDAFYVSMPELERVFLIQDFERAKQYVVARSLEDTATIVRLMFEAEQIRLTAFCADTNCKFLRQLECFYKADIVEDRENQKKKHKHLSLADVFARCGYGALEAERNQNGETADSNILYIVVPKLSILELKEDLEDADSLVFECGLTELVAEFTKNVSRIQVSDFFKLSSSGGNKIKYETISAATPTVVNNISSAMKHEKKSNYITGSLCQEQKKAAEGTKKPSKVLSADRAGNKASARRHSSTSEREDVLSTRDHGAGDYMINNMLESSSEKQSYYNTSTSTTERPAKKIYSAQLESPIKKMMNVSHDIIFSDDEDVDHFNKNTTSTNKKGAVSIKNRTVKTSLLESNPPSPINIIKKGSACSSSLSKKVKSVKHNEIKETEKDKAATDETPNSTILWSMYSLYPVIFILIAACVLGLLKVTEQF